MAGGQGLASEGEVGNRVLTSAQFPLLPKEGKDRIDFNFFLLLKMSTGPFFSHVIFRGTPCT